MSFFRRNGHTPEVPDANVAVREAVQVVEQQYGDTILLFQERLAELEFALEDQGWERLMEGGDREFSRDALKRICSLSRLMYLKNPLINRAVSLQAAYVFGQGVNISSDDDAANETIQAFVDDPANQAELTSHQSRMLKEVDLTVLGNIFFVLFTGPDNLVKVRSISVDEIVDIVCNPEDSKDKWFYKRVWTPRAFNTSSGLYEGQQQEAYYPDWRYNPKAGKVPTIGGKPVHWDSPIYHLKVGGMSEMRFGVPETYAALDWATAYKGFLEDVATQMRALTRFAHQLTTSGGARGVAAAKTRLNTTLGSSGETNPPPLAGSTFIAANGTSLSPMNVANAAVKAEDGRRFLLMVAAATGLPETFFGDASVGTLATAKSLDRPTELKMIDRRTLWADCYKDLIGYVLAKKENRGGVEIMMQSDVQIDVDYPALLEHDVEATVRAIVSAATLDGKTLAGTIEAELVSRMLLTALGEDDVDELLAGMDFSQMQIGPAPVQPVDPNNPPNPSDPNAPSAPLTPRESLYLEAVREVRRARAEAGE